jgi:ABC-type multidrug transport system ATPase subunit
VSGLSKRYGDGEAVKGVSFSVARGEVFAFLGPNGAGKTTTINMLCTLVQPTGGRAWVDGFDVQSLLRLRTLVGETAAHDPPPGWDVTFGPVCTHPARDP